MTVETFVVVTTGCATGITWVGPRVRRNNPQRSGRPRAENHPPKVPIRPGVRAPSPHRVGGRQKPRRPGPERWRVNTGSHRTLESQRTVATAEPALPAVPGSAWGHGAPTRMSGEVTLLPQRSPPGVRPRPPRALRGLGHTLCWQPGGLSLCTERSKAALRVASGSHRAGLAHSPTQDLRPQHLRPEAPRGLEHAHHP